ncbi:solute carrier family 35 member E3-like [Schistocerca piceifrons]|uniref:solute carrier family 35 member E3-like n=1 Tax=Schistocerca piceifrons TaxID=274613 RepID=UPI001F5FCB63|nr:solute carrier family 35 member E3-like [Schistocerca piceifrons]
MRKRMNKETVTSFFLFFNICCSICIVLLNKWVYVHVGFPNIALTFLHFVVTYIGLEVCRRCSVFVKKSLQVKDIISVAITFCGFVVFTNLSLQHNTVGTFQIAKSLTTPFIIILQMMLYGKKFSVRVKLTLIPITVGVFLNFYYDLQFSFLGTVYASVAVVVTSFYQVLVSKKQQDLQVDPMQLLYYQAPISSLILLILLPFIEPVVFTISHNWRTADVCMILASCFIAFFVNISIYWIIGNTSPLTYNMVGHLKFCVTMLGGVLLFEDPLHINQGVGILLTVIGITSYAHVKVTELRPVPKTVEEGFQILPGGRIS